MSLYGHLQERGPHERPVTVTTLSRMRGEGEKIACITAYDASFATLVDLAGADLVLVGDSLGMVIQGHDTTVPVTVDDIVYPSASNRAGEIIVEAGHKISRDAAETICTAGVKTCEIMLPPRTPLIFNSLIEDNTSSHEEALGPTCLRQALRR